MVMGERFLLMMSELDMLLRSIRVHGSGTDKYSNDRIGINGRLDSIQAAVLLEKLTIFDDELEARQRIAESYTQEVAVQGRCSQDSGTLSFSMGTILSACLIS